MIRKILFRADANSLRGTGDLTSFLNLAEYFKKLGWSVHFMVKDYPIAIKLLRNFRADNKLVLRKNVSTDHEWGIVNRYCVKYGITAVFLQLKEDKLRHYVGLQNNIFKACMYFDYGLPKGYDLVLSWDVNSKDYFAKGSYPGTRFFLGPEYVILPINFDKTVIKNRILGKKREKLLVAMGGADKHNLTEKVVRRLAKIHCNLDIRIIAGAGYNNLAVLKSVLCRYFPGHELIRNTKDMFREYMNCDIAIGAGGLTSSELVATRTPALLVAAYEHQIARCRYFQKKAWAKYLGYRNVAGIHMSDLLGFMPSTKTEFDIKISEVVRYIDRACR